MNTVNEINDSVFSRFTNFLRTTKVIYRRQNLRLISNKAQVISMLIMPILWLAIMGQAFDNLLGGPMSPLGMDYITYMTPGMLVQVTLFSSLFGSISLFYDRDSGYLKNYLIAPISRTAIFSGYVLGLMTRIFIQAAILLVMGLLLGAEIDITLANILVMIVLIAFLTMFIFGLTITIASKAPNVEVFQAMIMPLSMPLMFLSPMLFPADMLPDYLSWFTKINPVTFGVDSIRGMLFGAAYVSEPLFNWDIITNHLIRYNLLILILFGIIFLYLGSKAFLQSLDK